MFKSKLFFIILIVVIIVSVLIYKKYHSNKADNEVAYLMLTTNGQNSPANNATKNNATPKKLFGTMILISGKANSQDMANGIVCLENAKDLDKVDLFMPDMGHGSEPPKVTPINVPNEFSKYNKTISNFGCYSVESMQLFMPGFWQVRIFYKDGTMGIFGLNLNK